MKHLKLSFLFAILLSMVGLKSFATIIDVNNAEIEVKNSDGVTIYYGWNDNKTSLYVTRGTGNQRYSGSVVIPNSVTYQGKTYPVIGIDFEAFYLCSDLLSVYIPNTVKSIGNDAFHECSKLSSITIPNSVEEIGEYVFVGCHSITSFTIPNSVSAIGECAFARCDNLTSINVESGNTKYDSRENCNAIIETSSNTLISGCKTTIIPKSVTTIGKYAFYNLGWSTISIPNNVTNIEHHAFYRCYNLSSVKLPASLNEISGAAFDGCTNLTDIYCYANTPPKHDYSSLPSNVILHVPYASLDAYKSDSYWKKIKTIVMIENILTYVVDGKVYKKYYLEEGTSITPEATPTKEGYTFSGWSDIPATMPGHDVTVTGTFSINKYKLTYQVDGVVYKSFEMEYGKWINLEAAPSKEGYTFSGWSGSPGYMPAHDVIITGTFNINSYKLTYKVDGVDYKTYDVEYGITITPEIAPTKEGYTFSGWSEIPQTMPANDVTVTGTFTVNKYKLTYMVDGVNYKTYDVEYGSAITPETIPTKEGYAFSGWSGIPETMPANDVTVTGTFSISKYKLIYKVDDADYKTYNVEYGVSITPEAAPTKEGYTFSGWSEIPQTMPAHDVTITGTFSINKYKLTYKVDGVDYKTYDVEYGTAITPETAPTREGYTFSGWSEIPQTMPANNVTVTGTFTVNKYKLMYKVDGVDYKSYDVEYGTAITPETAPIKEGYTFSGWSDIPQTMPANDVTVTGTFSVNKYKLTYKVDGADYKTYDVEYGASITPETAPTKEGYTFSGWSDIPQTMPANDITVTGTFTVNKYKLTYKVDGADYKTYDVEYGTAITPETAPTKEGYTFSGWSVIPQTMPAHDVTVTGTFGINKYKLTYKVDGADYKTYDVEYGAAITPETAPIREGYTFSGWSEIPQTMPARDVTVTGTFTINKYKLIYKVDGADYKTYDVEYGTAITPEAVPTKEGYTFSGWSDIPQTMPAHDVTVTGTFGINKYKLTYKVDGADYKTFDLDFGTAITPETAPTRDGYTFSGWSDIPQTMPAHDVTVTGTFTINKYKLIYKVDGVDYKTYELEYGAQITPEANPTKEGYTFSGWGNIPATMPAYDVTVSGTFSKGAYKIVYMVDGVVYKTISYDYGDAITPEAAPTKEGYTFSGWSEIPQTMPARDLTVTGTFSINKYKLIYKVDGADYKTYELEYGKAITPEQAPTKEGYTFSGWSEIPQTMPARDVTVSGTFNVNKYKLIYKVDGTDYKTYELEYGKAITPEQAPTKEGYTFSGWSEIPQTMPARDVTVTGTFTINKYKLVYKVDGEDYRSYELVYGTSITPEPVPTKEGYTFSGWSEIPQTMPAKDVTITSEFTVNKYKITYLLDGVVYKTYELEYGATITPEADPTKEGYTFSGWGNIPATMPAYDVTVSGTFSKGAYKLIYMVDGAVYKTIGYDFGDAITPEAAPTKEGYTFSGWSEIPETMPAKDVTVTGTFTINKYQLTYMIDNVVYKTYELEYGAPITPEAEPTKEGYTFSGWSVIPQTMPAADVTITGSFIKGTYKLTYMVDGSVYKTVSYAVGDAITPEAAPAKEGYTFSGWSEIPTTMPAYDVTVNGSFTVNKYKLTYMVDGEVYKTYDIAYGAAITPEPAPEKEGYEFSGWSWIPSKMPAEDVVVTGSFKQTAEIEDGVTYEIEGETVVVTQTISVSGEVKIEETVEIDGKTYKVTAIAEGAFQGRVEMTAVEIPSSIVAIGKNAFEGCNGLRIIRIGSGVKEIAERAFANIFTNKARTRGEEDGLHVYCDSEAIPATAANAFEGTPISEATLHVADGLVDIYKYVTPWNGFGKIVGLTDTGIGSITFDSPNARIYDMQGNRLDKPQKGVNIIRTEDGRSKKIVVK